MGLEEKVQALSATVDRYDKENEALEGDVAKTTVEREEEIVEKTAVLLEKAEKVFAHDEIGEAHKKALTKYIGELLDSKNTELAFLHSTTDWHLQTFVDEMLGELDGLIEEIEAPKKADERMQFVVDFEKEFPEFKVEDFLSTLDANSFRRGGDGYYLHALFSEVRAEYEKTKQQYDRYPGPQARTREAEAWKSLSGKIGTKRMAQLCAADNDSQYLAGKVSTFETYAPREEMLQVIDAAPKSAARVLAAINALAEKGFVISDRVGFARKFDEATSKKEISAWELNDITKIAQNDEHVLHLLKLQQSYDHCFRSVDDIAILARLGHIDVLSLDAPRFKKLTYLNYAQGTEVEKYNAFAGYRRLMKYTSVDELAKVAELLDKGMSIFFSGFVNFVLKAEHLLPGASLSQLAIRFKRADLLGAVEFRILSGSLSRATSWDDAFDIVKKVSKLTENKKKQDLKTLADVYPKLTDETLKNESAYYRELIVGLDQHYESGRFNKNDPDSVKTIDEAVAIVAEVWLDSQKIANTQSNRSRLRAIHPAVLALYEAQNPSVALVEEPQATPLGIRERTAPGTLDKVSDRSLAYLTERGLAILSNINGINLNELGMVSEVQNGIEYNRYLDGGTEVVRAIKLNPANAGFGVYHSRKRDENDTPMEKIPGTLVEATACMIEETTRRPTELLAVQGEVLEADFHPSHDGLLIIGKDGIPKIEHVEFIDGSMLGTDGVIDGKHKDRERFAELIAEKNLTVMQAPLFVKDGKPLPVSASGTSWYKRAFVTFLDGSAGFVESREPVDNKTFLKLLIDMSAKDAILLDTGYFDNYTDVNGNKKRSREFAPVQLYAKRR
ncbi:MAG: hypothetical protein AAB588_02630 [Patescibacteria group bacterium]